MVTVCHTARLSPADLTEARALCAVAFGGFTDHDWDHALGGEHALVHADGVLVAHGSLVLRRLLVEGHWLRCGYVEAVAVHPDFQRRGLGHQVLASLEELAPGYELLALCASKEGRPLYESRDWSRWRGPTSALTAEGLRPTPDEDSIYVLGTALDLDAPIACDWRAGDVW